MSRFPNLAKIDVGQFVVTGTRSIFTAIEAVKQVNANLIYLKQMSTHKKVALIIEEQCLEIWQREEFYHHQVT